MTLPVFTLALRRLLVLLGCLAALGSPAFGAEAPRDYQLGIGDVIRIQVFQSPELLLEARLNEAGVIGYPLLGDVKLGGLTASQAEQRIAQGLRDGGYVRQPQVNIAVLSVRGHQVSVLGLVGKPGRYPLDLAGMRLSEVLALAGGVMPGGADTLSVSGTRDGKPFRKEIDLRQLLNATGADDPVLVNGDLVFVDRMPTIYVYGEVQRPGQMRLERDMNVMQALATAGGLTPRGTEKGLRVSRRDGKGALQKLSPGMDDKLQDGDVVYVRESLF